MHKLFMTFGFDSADDIPEPPPYPENWEELAVEPSPAELEAMNECALSLLADFEMEKI